MIPYLDASAFVKRYGMEPGSREVVELEAGARAVATALVSRAEVAAALGPPHAPGDARWSRGGARAATVRA